VCDDVFNVEFLVGEKDHRHDPQIVPADVDHVSLVLVLEVITRKIAR
jgi:hypothetical protein